VSPAYVGTQLVHGYVGGGAATGTQVDLVALAQGGAAPMPPPSSGKIFVGARITGSYEKTTMGALDANDAPYSADPALPHPTAWDTFEGINGNTRPGSMGGARLAYVQFGLGVGWTAGNPTATANFATVYGNLINWAQARGAFTQFDWGATTTALTDILADNATARSNFSALADAMYANGKPVLFRPLWEMNGGWYAWGIGGTGNISHAQYITIWRRIWQYFADRKAGVAAGTGTGTGTGNVSFFWCPNYWISTSSPTNQGMQRYPGDAYVDWVGPDGYARANTGATPNSLFDYTLAEMTSVVAASKPFAIGEWGCMDSVGGAGKAAFFNTFFGSFLQKWPRLKAANYFHASGADGTDNWIPTIEANRAAYATGVAAVGLGNTTTLPLNQKVPIPA
jgi:hypothetical protein